MAFKAVFSETWSGCFITGASESIVWNYACRPVIIVFDCREDASRSPSPRPSRGRRKQAMLANGALVKLLLA